MKIMTLLGTRPEIIRLSRIIEKLDGLMSHVIVHTGQNYDPRLNQLFFDELGVRAPDHYLGVRGGFGEQVGQILAGLEQLLVKERPERLLVLGDTNSGLGAIVAKRLGVPVYHMEAGNRCYDDRVPEEVNRRVIDHSSDVLMPYTERSRQNLLREGIPGERIFVTGNPILEVLTYFESEIAQSDALSRLGLTPGGYVLVTLHRAENVDVPKRLHSYLTAFDRVQRELGAPVIVSTHPRMRDRLTTESGMVSNECVQFLEPFGLFDFICLEKQAICVLSDSGTVQEECAIFGVPNITLRDVTERPETLECGSNLLSGSEHDSILQAMRAVLALDRGWEPPAEYRAENVSDRVIRILLSFDLASARRAALL